MPADDRALPPGLLGAAIDYALGRLEYARHACDESDRTGVLHALHQLKGMCAHTGDDGLVALVHAVEGRAVDAASMADLAAVLERDLPRVAAALDGLDPDRVAVRTRPLDHVFAAATEAAGRVARRRGVDLVADPPVGGEIELPARTAMMLVDHLGHLVRNAIVHGSGSGTVTLTLRGALDGDGGLVCTVANRGEPTHAAAAVDVDGGRGLALAAIDADLRRIGGRLTHGPTRDGYVATVRVPASWMVVSAR